MGQCKVCGKEIADGMEYCEDCQAELQGLELDAEELEQISLDVDEDVDLPELSGDLLETDLDFILEDPENNLENPTMVVREKETQQKAEEPLPSMDIPEIAEPEVVAAAEEVSLEDVATIPDLPLEDMETPTEIPGDLPIPDLDQAVGAESEPASEVEVPDLEMASVEEEIPMSMEETPAGNIPEVDLPSTEESVPMGEDSAGAGMELDSLLADITGLDGGLGLEGMLPEDQATDSAMPDFVDLDSDLQGDVSASADDGLLDAMYDVPDAEEMVEASAKKPRISIWKRLFGNIKDDKWEKQKAKAEAAKEAKAKAKKEAEEAKAEENADGIDPKEAKKAEKLAKKEEKARLKAERKEAKQKQKELAALEDEDDEGRINRVGATIIFVLCGIFTLFTILGTNHFDYTNSMKKANAYFKEDDYASAYTAIHGLKVKEKDQKFYDQVRTVMYVDRELLSYQNYSNIRMYPEALHALLQGVEKYDVYLDDAVALDVTDDMDKVRSRILQALDQDYSVSEEEAYKLNAIEDQEEYSEKVISIANQ